MPKNLWSKTDYKICMEKVMRKEKSALLVSKGVLQLVKPQKESNNKEDTNPPKTKDVQSKYI